jgi:N-acetylneuraminate epimerase
MPRFLILAMTFTLAVSAVLPARDLTWDRLHDLPDAHGFAGAFAGVHGDALIVAGGSNFSETPLWEKGPKVWHDRIFVLPDPDGEWIEAGRLPRAVAEGVSISTNRGVLCIGGGDSDRHFSDVFLLQWEGGCIQIVEQAALPVPLAGAAGARVGNVVYVAGGRLNPKDTRASAVFLALDLTDMERGWQEVKSWPGPERMLAVAAADEEAFYLISGIQLREGETVQERLGYLTDVYAYRGGSGWSRLPDLPHPVAAAPSPSVVAAPGEPMVFGGVDGKQLGLSPRRHPGLPNEVLQLDPEAGEWRVVGQTPAARVVLPAVEWGGKVVFPSGELSPGVRSPQIWRLTIAK